MMSNDNPNEITAYKTVDEALHSYPLAEVSPEFAATILNQLSPRQALPQFRLDWFDYAISFFATGMAALLLILWQRFPLFDFPAESLAAVKALPDLSSVTFIIVGGILAGVVALAIAAATLTLNRLSITT